MNDHPIMQWLYVGVGVMAFFIVVKAAASYLPGSGIGGAVKKAVLFA